MNKKEIQRLWHNYGGGLHQSQTRLDRESIDSQDLDMFFTVLVAKFTELHSELASTKLALSAAKDRISVIAKLSSEF